MKKWLSLAASAALVLSMTGCSSESGTDGLDGADGISGINGTDGTDGINGIEGVDGKDGEDLTLSLGVKASKIQFSSIETPLGDDQKSIQSSNMVTFGDETQAIGFTKLLATGDTNNNEIFGLVKDYQDNPITFSDGTSYICNGTNSGIGSGLDYTSILQKNNKLYMVSQFECQVGAIYMAELEQNSATGALNVKDNSLEFISQKDEFGGFVHCAGQKTPWESHLGSEEYEPNAKAVETDADATTGLTGDKYYDETAKFWGNDATKISPYYYGWTPEVAINSDGTPTYTKHYSIGRFSHELSYVMPDRKTVYMSDDGTNVGLFMYVAYKAEDLSAGTLYAAKWSQTSDANGGRGDMSWIKLASAKDSDIKAILDPDNNVTTNDAPKFSDIFDINTTADAQTCSNGYTPINTSAGFECLRVKTGKESEAAYLETRRYAAIKGATTEFRKEEGITFSADHNKLFVAMSEIAYGMEDKAKKGQEDTQYDNGGNNDIKLGYNPCGAVYALDVASVTQKDSSGAAIESAYVVNNMYSIINGVPKTYDANTTYEGNTCDVDAIANPDNVAYLDGSNLLFIGEDTSAHLNNIIWAYDITNGSLTRVFAAPLDAETTSPFWYKNINGWAYMTAVTQHPMEDQSDATAFEKESSVGVLGAIKNLDTLNGSRLIRLGSYDTGTEGGSEISAFDGTTKKLFITNGAANKVDIVDLSDVQSPKLLSSIDLSTFGSGVQSVAVKNGKVAVAVSAADKVSTKGKVALFSTTDYSLVSQTQVGYLPDMVSFNEDGTKIIVANEGEPDAAGGSYVDVPGSIGVIAVASATAADDSAGYTDINFSNAVMTSALDGTAVRLGGTPSNDKALDIEPEYIAVKGGFAYVTLQENNSIAKVDLSNDTLTLVKSFGSKDYESENKIDIEEDGVIKLKNYKGLKSLYMPDSIASYDFGGATYLVTANEGDGREYLDSAENDVFVDEKKISKLTLDTSIADFYADDNDLKVMTDISTSTELYTFGARSFSIWDENGDLVWDSGDELSRLVATYEPKLFNQDDGIMDGRSGNKGVEPEALTVGTIDGKTYAFIGLERQSALVIYDITNPYAAKFVDYAATHVQNNLSPEGMIFVPAASSPNGKNLLVVSYEVSGSTVVYEIK